MTVSPGTGRKLWRATPKPLLLFARPSVFLLKSGQRARLLSALSQGNRHSASSNSTPLLNKLSWSRESLADELRHSGAHSPGLDRRCPRYLTDALADVSAILQGMVASRTTRS